MSPMILHHRLTRNTRGPRKEHSRRPGKQLVTLDAPVKSVHIEVRRAAVAVDRREERLPADSIAERVSWSCFPRVAEICPGVFVTLQRRRWRTHRPLCDVPHHEVGQRQCCYLPAECRSSVRIEIRVGIDPPPRKLRADRKLMIAVNDTEVVITTEDDRKSTRL